MSSFAQFWPRYLKAHADPRTRAIHVVGTIAATSLVLTSIATRKPWLAAIGLVAGYGPAWYAHFFIEKNKPETLRAPILSLVADYVMAWHVLQGSIDEQITIVNGAHH